MASPPRAEQGAAAGRWSSWLARRQRRASDRANIDRSQAFVGGIRSWAQRRPVNLKFVFEGEEENGSEHLDAWLEANRDRLHGDVAIISDTSFFDGNLPAITIGLRGLMAAQIDVTGPSLDLHSGTYGGTVENPIFVLATIIAALKGPDGRIQVPGFYDDVRPLTDLDRESLRKLPIDERTYLEVDRRARPRRGSRVHDPRAPRGPSDPSKINGAWGGFEGEGTKTIIPAHAHAKITCRLVADQHPETLFERLRAYVEDIAPPSVLVDVKYLGGGLPSITPIDHPATRAAARCPRCNVRPRAALRPRGRVDPGCGQLRADLGFRSSSSVSPRPTTTPMPPTST